MQRNTLLLIVRYECFKNVSYVTGSITKFKKSVGWTIDKFWLNNSMVINGTILSFAYQKWTSKDVRFQVFGISAVATTNNSCLNIGVGRMG